MRSIWSREKKFFLFSIILLAWGTFAIGTTFTKKTEDEVNKLIGPKYAVKIHLLSNSVSISNQSNEIVLFTRCEEACDKQTILNIYNKNIELIKSQLPNEGVKNVRK